METQDLVERGWLATLAAPELEASDRAGRLDQAERAFLAFAPVLRPLALEVERCWRAIDLGLPSRGAYPDPAWCILTSSDAPADVVAKPTVASPPPPRPVPRLDRAAIAECLRDGEPPPDPSLLLDWRSIQTIAAAVRALRPLPELRLRPAGRTIRAYEPGWFAGPLGATGFEAWPPAELILRAEDRVVLTLNVYWSGWRSAGTPERAAFEAGIGELERAGWRREDAA
jgi:hypothetical protein